VSLRAKLVLALVLLTSMGFSGDAVQLRQRGFVACLSKPLTRPGSATRT
jgi:BarA-like signal transduction histidine kinase